MMGKGEMKGRDKGGEGIRMPSPGKNPAGAHHHMRVALHCCAVNVCSSNILM